MKDEVYAGDTQNRGVLLTSDYLQNKDDLISMHLACVGNSRKQEIFKRIKSPESSNVSVAVLKTYADAVRFGAQK